MAVDRERIVRSVLDSLGVVPAGPFARALATSDSTLPQLPYDPARARALLDSAGWRDRDGNGTREKNGKALRFSIVIPSSSTSRNRAAVLIQEMFNQVGARMDLQQMEFNAWRELTQSRNFDATFNAVHFDPSPSTIRQSWTSQSARDPDGSNYSTYSNPEFDALVDSAVNEMDQARSTELYHRAYRILNADVPAIFTYEPVNLALRRKRLLPAPMRADAWWTSIADWKIAPDGRLPRDEMSGVAARN
jgi:peptide/nickel transport system substrate-binding protein